MATKPTVGISSVASQASRRYLDTFFDQHRSPRFPNGRPWWGTREFAANQGHRDGFVGVLMPGDHNDPMNSVWNAPWLPGQVSTVNGGSYYDLNYTRNKITIRYERIVADDTKAFRQYYDAAAVIAHENTWVPPEFGTMPRHAITAIIGRPPRSPKVAQAAQAGDPWLLGHTDEVNEELATLLGLSKQGMAFAFRSQEQPLASPEQVLSVTPDVLQRMIQEGVQRALDAQTEERKAKMATVRAARKTGKSTTATSAVTS